MAEKFRRHIEQYQDMIARLFPPTKEQIEKAGERKILTRVLTFQVTDGCNLGCKYCYQINKGRRKMSFETAKKMIDMVLEEPEKLNNYLNPDISPGLVLEFIGGEPFLEIELIDKIVDYFVARTIELEHPWATRFCISICSNGALYFNDKVQNFFKKHRHRISFSVTIDGNRELHDSCRVFLGTEFGSYDIAAAASEDWMSRGYYMGSKITIAPGNLDYLYDAIVHMVELGYDEINANTVYEKGWTIEHARKYYEELIRISDYWIDNDLVESHYLSLFEEGFFKPKEESDDSNWCFKAGTKILMADGTEKNIEDIKIGDIVSVGFGKNSKEVENVTSHFAKNTWILEVEGLPTLYTTEDHPIYTPISFRKAKTLKPGDEVCVIKDDGYFKKVKVLKSEKANEEYQVYNMTVKHFHTFVANKVIVHNCGGNGEMLSVDPDGYLYPCIRYMESSLGSQREPYRIGDVDNGIGFTDEYKQKIKCLHCITRRSQSTDECFNCPIAEGCSWCFPAGTKILTKDGYKNIEEIQIGDYVYDKDNNLQLVSNNMSRLAQKDELVYIKASGLKDLLVTQDHPFYAKKVIKRHHNIPIYGDPTWVAAKDLKTSDKIGLFIPKFGTKHIEPNKAYLLGRYVGDGWKTASNRIAHPYKYYICCAYDETKELEEYFNLANIKYNRSDNRTVAEYHINITNNEDFIQLIDQCGNKAGDKKVPMDVCSWDKESIENFLKGYFDADGSIDKKNNVQRYSTISYELCLGIATLVRMVYHKNVNITVNNRKSTSIIEGRIVNQSTAYEGRFKIDTPSKKYYEFDEENNIMWVNVAFSKKVVPDSIEVYNLTVDNTHNYIADNVIVHNCSAYNY